jgi:hypothetical protein
MIFIYYFYCYVGGGVSFLGTKLTKKHKGHEDILKLSSQKIKNL